MITAGHMCYLSRIAATLTTCGRHPAIDYAGNPECMVMWGCNPLSTNPDEYKGVRFWNAYQKGAKLIVIDPRKGFLAKKADVWLQVRPGTDAALAMGFHRVIIEEGLDDGNTPACLSICPTGCIRQGEKKSIAAVFERTSA